jgi:pimeloyl-ACP methyl ester carboxylesterase
MMVRQSAPAASTMDVPGREAAARPLHLGIQHYPQTALRWLSQEAWMPNSVALLCRSPRPGTAVVFVHGWGGRGCGTWETFPQFAATMPETSDADLFFLEYPSLKSQVPFCAAQLRNFLVDLVRDPIDTIVGPSLPVAAPRRSQDRRYRRFIIVAHSMGAVISRRALLDLDQQAPGGLTDNELRRFQLLFFAPAHSGSAIPLLIGSGLGLDFLPGAKFVGSLARIWFQSLRDLEEGSAFLHKLADDCKQLREERTERGASTHHLRAVVYHAHNDHVVSQNDFDRDRPFRPVMNRNHRTICKPSEAYREPIEAFRALLNP